MTLPLEAVETEAPAEERERPRREQPPRGEDTWYSQPAPPLVLSEEEFAVLERVVRDPPPLSPEVRARLARYKDL